MDRGVKNEKREQKIRHLIDVAIQVFAEKGYEGARTDDIADRAGISKMSMYYYIGDKETLYEAVINDLIASAEHHIVSVISPEDTPENNMKKIIRGIAEVADKEPYLHAVLLRELISGGDHLPGDHSKGLQKQIKIIKSVIDQGKEEAVFFDADPAVLFFMLMSFFVYWKFHLPVISVADFQSHFSKDDGSTISTGLIDYIETMFFKILTCHSD